jgi:hypothetical protein
MIDGSAACRHLHRAPAPPGKYLPICLDCAKRVLDCDMTITAGPHIVGSGWMERGHRDEDGTEYRWTYCPACWSRAMVR